MCIFSLITFLCDVWASLGSWPICAPCGWTVWELFSGSVWVCLRVSVCTGWAFDRTWSGVSLPASAEETGIKASVISREHYVILWAYFFMASKTLVLQRKHLKAEYSGTVYWACVVNSLKRSATFTCDISGLFNNPLQYNLSYIQLGKVLHVLK